MQITKTTKSPTQATLRISADAIDLAPIKRHTLGHFVDQVKIPGFRSGKAPLEVVEKHVNQQTFLQEFTDHAINELYRRAIDHEKLRPVAQPSVAVKKLVPYSDLEFEVTIDVLGPIELADYKKIKIAKPPINITANDVNEVVKSLQQRLAERADVTRPAKAGDELVIDFAGKDAGGKPVAGADGKDYPIIIGSDTFIPGFEDHLLGTKAGEVKEFSIAFPKNYGVAALQGKKVKFKVDIKKVSELTRPKVDDALAVKAGRFKTLAELKTDIKKQLKIERQNQADQQHENELVEAITLKSKLDVPKVLVDQQIVQMEEDEKRNLAYRGQTWQEHLVEEGINEEQHRERQRPVAEARVKGGLVLSEIAEREEISVTPEELELRLQILKGQYQDPQMQSELDKPENRQDIEARLLTEKTLAKIVDYSSKK